MKLLCFDIAVMYSRYCLFVLRINTPVNNFSVMLGWRFQVTLPGYKPVLRGEIKYLTQEHNMVLPVEIKPRTSPFGFKCSSTALPSLQNIRVNRAVSMASIMFQK